MNFEVLFSEGQLEVLRLMPTHIQKEIARELGISRFAVNGRQTLIRRKLRVNDRAQAVMKAIWLGIIDYA